MKKLPAPHWLLIAACSLFGCNLLRAESTKPDVLFILVDDLRWDALGYMNHPFVKTPNIDRLRAEGAMMANAFVTTSICCPSRATFLTGTLANRHGVIDNETSEYNPEVTPPLTKYLQAAGYKTAMIGKWHMGETAAPRAYFDYWLSFKGQGVYNDPLFNINGKEVPQKGYTTDLLTDQAIQFIENQPKDRPYFAMLSHKAVHEPFHPAPRHTEAYGADAAIPLPLSWSDDFSTKPDWQKRDALGDVRWHYRTREREQEKLPASVPADTWRKGRDFVEQLRCLAAVDEGIGRLIEALRKRGTLDHTLIVFTSDNGYFHGEHRRWDKRLAYEESLRIPMVVFYPGHIKAGSTVPQLITNVDFAPTILDYAGLPIPAGMQGASMKPLFEEQAPHWRDYVFYEYWKDLVHSIPTMTGVRTDRYKLLTYPEINDLDELYDLQNDPHEMRNLARDPAYAQLHAEMTARLQKASVAHDWKRDVFPHNLPRVRGKAGTLLDLAVTNGAIADAAGSGLTIDLANTQVRDGAAYFDGKQNAIRISYNQLTDPTGWPFHIRLQVKPEGDGVLVTQATKNYGLKLFVQDGRPGFAVQCKGWVDTTTVIDAPESVIGKWTEMEALIDYNRITLAIDGRVVESVSLPQPFKGSVRAPLVVGNIGEFPVVEGVPHQAFTGSIRRLTLSRGLAGQ
ncbi:MAG TPA: sulfatase-like hydrolase/transferase [Lacunisphaera sp.]